MIQALQLGASLYVPATRPDLAAIGNGRRVPGLRSVIFCTEDAIRPSESTLALHNLESALIQFEAGPVLRFVRVRNPATLGRLLAMTGVDRLAGFVLPKATHHNLRDYVDLLPAKSAFSLMPILETTEVFDPGEMAALRTLLLHDGIRQRILSLRIGGNDLLQLLGLRRPRRRTIYATPLAMLIAQLVAAFRPHGFNLTGPVFEGLGGGRLLARETRRDVAQGLFGKGAIHPEQIPIIEAEYRAPATDVEAAERILAADAPPVFRFGDAMCEPATHRAWAEILLQRARLYGIARDEASRDARRLRPRPWPAQALGNGKAE